MKNFNIFRRKSCIIHGGKVENAKVFINLMTLPKLKVEYLTSKNSFLKLKRAPFSPRPVLNTEHKTQVFYIIDMGQE